ncbi:hypothetical protein PHYPO_G00014350 [Pangasianodon hypophthalmus]|uniref:Uncharacterized protein n=1 Tax=Pangasianodon hypophthalmus TaxID=310915 RepID=A0A5N5N3K1_PANHP|nr:hypothetical protein PHYPO_G00014350 [Pangasianodon hypophthalmus]
MFSGLRGQVRAVLRVKLAKQDHRSNIYSKPPKEKIGPGQTVFTMSIFALGLLVPAGWIMYHIPVYRQTPPSQV